MRQARSSRQDASERDAVPRASDRGRGRARVHVRVDEIEPAAAQESLKQTRVGDRYAAFDQMLREDAERDSRPDDVRTERARQRTGDRHVVPAPLEPGRQTDDVSLGATDVERIAHEEDSQPKVGPSEPTDGSSS